MLVSVYLARAKECYEFSYKPYLMVSSIYYGR